MSTRANIRVIDASKSELLFYRHSDGYPESVMPMLEKFLDYVKNGIIRDNVSQACGWLIMFGAKEYAKFTENGMSKDITIPTGENKITGWKVGSIEPTSEIGGDIHYLYTVNLADKTIEVERK